MSHASKTRNPGGSAVYTNGFDEYSDFVTVIEGLRPINMLDGTVERWGDYVGIQRMYNDPGSVWVSMSYGRFSNLNEAWIAKLARVEENVATDETENIKLTTYPNPTDNYVQLEIENPSNGRINITLYSMTGQPVKTLFEGPSNYPGKANISFSTHSLPAGEYVVHVTIDGKMAATKQIVKS
jgi:hypothetical protein